jgi:hypothetical protein
MDEPSPGPSARDTAPVPRRRDGAPRAIVGGDEGLDLDLPCAGRPEADVHDRSPERPLAEMPDRAPGQAVVNVIGLPGRSG